MTPGARKVGERERKRGLERREELEKKTEETESSNNKDWKRRWDVAVVQKYFTCRSNKQLLSWAKEFQVITDRLIDLHREGHLRSPSLTSLLISETFCSHSLPKSGVLTIFFMLSPVFSTGFFMSSKIYSFLRMHDNLVLWCQGYVALPTFPDFYFSWSFLNVPLTP